MTTCPNCGTRFSDTQRLCPHDGAVLEPDQAPELSEVGKILDGKYRLDGFISRGGMGAVYRGTHVMLGRAVAVKLISPHLVASPDMVRRFQREARAVTHLDHRHIVKVYDLGQTSDGTLYIAMDLVAGESLNALIRRSGALAFDRIVTIVGQVASALALAHRNGVVHRDLKPHNIMIGRDENGRDVATLLDFGIAKTFEFDANTKLTATGSTIGTPHYMSPEQATGVDVDARSDLYSLGIILYEMLTGEVPFDGDSTPAVLVKQMNETPVPPSKRRPDLRIPPALEAIALRCLEKSPAKRFQTAGELGTELARVPVVAQIDHDGTVRVSPTKLARAQSTKTLPGQTEAVGFEPAPRWKTVEERVSEPTRATRQPTGPGTTPTVPAHETAAGPVPPAPLPRPSALVIAAPALLIAALAGVYWTTTQPAATVATEQLPTPAPPQSPPSFVSLAVRPPRPPGSAPEPAPTPSAEAATPLSRALQDRLQALFKDRRISSGITETTLVVRVLESETVYIAEITIAAKASTWSFTGRLPGSAASDEQALRNQVIDKVAGEIADYVELRKLP